MNHKNYALREMLVDKCLQNGRAMTGREIMDFVNRYLEENGFEIIQSRTTLMNTFDSMQANHRVIINKERRGNQWYYWYAGQILPSSRVMSPLMTMYGSGNC